MISLFFTSTFLVHPALVWFQRTQPAFSATNSTLVEPVCLLTFLPALCPYMSQAFLYSLPLPASPARLGLFHSFLYSNYTKLSNQSKKYRPIQFTLVLSSFSLKALKMYSIYFPTNCFLPCGYVLYYNSICIFSQTIFTSHFKARTVFYPTVLNSLLFIIYSQILSDKGAVISLLKN